MLGTNPFPYSNPYLAYVFSLDWISVFSLGPTHVHKDAEI